MAFPLRKRFFSFGFLTVGLISFALLAGNFAQAQTNLSAGQKDEIRALVKDYLIEHPEVIMQALEAFQKNQAEIEAKIATAKIAELSESLKSSKAPSVGAVDGDVMIVEFFDYNCGYCKVAYDDVLAITKDDKKVKFVFKELPILSDSSVDAARYALAAEKQGKYFEFHGALMKLQGQKNEAAFQKIARDLGLDFKKLQADAKSDAITKQLDDNKALAGELGVRGTPGFIIGDKLFPGYIGLDSMRDAIKTVRGDG